MEIKGEESIVVAKTGGGVVVVWVGSGNELVNLRFLTQRMMDGVRGIGSNGSLVELGVMAHEIGCTGTEISTHIVGGWVGVHGVKLGRADRVAACRGKEIGTVAELGRLFVVM